MNESTAAVLSSNNNDNNNNNIGTNGDESLDWDLDDDDDDDNNNNKLSSSNDARFSCNICLDAVQEPVVTQCGHLYCWPCLFRWLEPGMTQNERISLLGELSVSLHYHHHNQQVPQPSKRVCPVCKAPCSVKKIVPIYVRTEEQQRNEKEKQKKNKKKKRSSSNNRITPPDESHLYEDDDEGQEEEEEERREEQEISTQNNNQSDDEVVGVVEQRTDDGHDDEYTTAEAEETIIVHDDENNNDHDDTTTTTSNNNTGLRQRIRFRSTDSEIPTLPVVSSTTVPRRPAANSPMPPSRSNNSNNNNTTSSPARLYPLSPSVSIAPPSSLSHGMLPLVQHAWRRAAVASNGMDSDQSGMASSSVPPLHRLEEMQYEQIDNPGTTEFLSRILLLLGSFVILCLLLF